MPKLAFTKRALLAIPPAPKGTRVDYHDTKTPGLTLRVTHAGTKTFVLYRRIQGRPERVTLGKFPAMTVEQAQTEVARLQGQIAVGKNPADDKRATRGEMTLEAAFAEYLERHAKPHKKTWEDDQAQFDRYLSRWKSRKLSTIRPKNVQALHTKIGKDHGPYAANRLLALLKALFNRLSDWEYWKKPNPTKGTKLFKEYSRERFLQADELPAFFEALASEPNDTARDFFLIALLTGARRDNVLTMRWEDINLKRAEWRIPDTKTGDPHTVPLVPAAIEILRQRKPDDDDKDASPWVFPGTGDKGHFADPKKAWSRILKRAGLKDVRIHDLRRSLGSWQAATGASLSVIGKSLAHKNVSTTAIYARLNLDPVREAMNTATTAMLKAGGVEIEKKVGSQGSSNDD